jgi:hypothetical protein
LVTLNSGLPSANARAAPCSRSRSRPSESRIPRRPRRAML